MARKSRTIVLASASPRRIALLKQWGVNFKAVPSHVNENTDFVKPASIVKELALRKAESVAKKYKDAIVIGSDTIVVLKGQIIGKPANELHSQEILSKLNGTFHRVYTGVAVIDTKSRKKVVDYDVSRVKMRKLTPYEIISVAGKHLDKAGAYAVQEKGDRFVEKIIGDYYNVVGLPFFKTKKMLKRFGIEVRALNK